ncbi:hypothetical protein [Lentzea indica]|nr:hypothetical protein [Lentzea indica]
MLDVPRLRQLPVLPVDFSHSAELIDRGRERAEHCLDRLGPGGAMRCRN